MNLLDHTLLKVNLARASDTEVMSVSCPCPYLLFCWNKARGSSTNLSCSISKAIFITVLYSTIFPFTTSAFQLVTSIPLIFRTLLLERSSPFSMSSYQLLSDVDTKFKTLRTVVAIHNHRPIAIMSMVRPMPR
jgi:hypothetical protein